jgi:hypothetical protein
MRPIGRPFLRLHSYFNTPIPETIDLAPYHETARQRARFDQRRNSRPRFGTRRIPRRCDF